MRPDQNDRSAPQPLHIQVLLMHEWTPLAKNSYYAFYTSMRMAYLFRTLKAAGTTTPMTPPVLPFLAPATLVKSPRYEGFFYRRQARACGSSSSPHQWRRPYSSPPKPPPMTPEPRDRDTSRIGSSSEALTPEDSGIHISPTLHPRTHLS